jgi:hypothetical protein
LELNPAQPVRANSVAKDMRTIKAEHKPGERWVGSAVLPGGQIMV